jgi:cytochrome c1
MDKLSDSHIYTVIKQGGGAFGKPTMPANPQVTDEQAKHLIAYIRSISNTYKK